MSVDATSSDTVGMFMNQLFAHHELKGNAFVRTSCNDIFAENSHNVNMTRRGQPTAINWYLKEWMDVTFPHPRGRQAKMMELTGWPKATMSQLYNNKQDYSPKLVNEAAAALNTETWELLMHPEKAMRLRKMRASIEEYITVAHDVYEKKNIERLKSGNND